MDMQKRISLEEAQGHLLKAISPLAPVTLPLENALGLVLAEPVFSAMDQPPFPRSPYDGYALRSCDSAGAARETPVTLKVIDSSFAGSGGDVEVMRGQAARIMTGAVIPRGADCVIMQEKTDLGMDRVKIYKALSPYDNYCHRGEDFKAGDLLLEAGAQIRAGEYAVLTSAGRNTVAVYPKPSVFVVSTGEELQTLGEGLGWGQIYDSNSAYIGARLRELGLPIAKLERVGDDLDKIADSLSRAVKSAGLVITTGGVSVGQKDFVPEALSVLGAEIVFQGVDIKPGMPAAFAVLEGKPVLALSGNPFAAAVTFELLARSALARLASNPGLLPEQADLRLVEGFSKPRPVRRFLRGLAESGTVFVPGGQGNGQMRTMAGCNCLVEFPAGDFPLPAGSRVRAYML